MTNLLMAASLELGYDGAALLLFFSGDEDDTAAVGFRWFLDRVGSFRVWVS